MDKSSPPDRFAQLLTLSLFGCRVTRNSFFCDPYGALFNSPPPPYAEFSKIPGATLVSLLLNLFLSFFTCLSVSSPPSPCFYFSPAQHAQPVTLSFFTGVDLIYPGPPLTCCHPRFVSSSSQDPLLPIFFLFPIPLFLFYLIPGFHPADNLLRWAAFLASIIPT